MRLSKVLRSVLWLPWAAVALIVYVASFGAIKLLQKKTDKGVLRRVWSLFLPFLVSTEPSPVSVPNTVPLPYPAFAGWRSPRIAALALFAVLALVAALCWRMMDAPPVADFETWRMAFVAAAALSAIAFINGIPLPRFQKAALALRLPLGGRTLFALPEFVRGWFFMGLVGLGIYLVNHYAVQANILNGAFMNAITEKNSAEFTRVLKDFAVLLAIFTLLGPSYSYVKELLILEWTRFTTRFMLRLYTRNRNYYPVSLLRTPDNPNERIETDVAALCRASLSFAFIVVDSLVTFYLFGHILWDVEKGLVYDIPLGGYHLVVSHLLLIILIGYAIFGSNGVVRVGRRLIALQAKQKRLSADFRVGLVLFDKYAEPIAAYRGEEREYNHLWGRFILALKNNYCIVRWQRNLGFFTAGYSRIAALLPYAGLAPFYFAGQIPFGAISQASGAFSDILSSASIFVSEFDRITGLLASLDRVSELKEALESYERDEQDGKPRIRHEEGDMLTVEHMTLYAPDRSKVLVRDFNLDVKPGSSYLIKGPSGSGKTSILRAIKGLPMWDRGDGLIRASSKPGHSLMLTQLAYLMSDATLREQMTYPQATSATDVTLAAVLKDVNLLSLVADLGGSQTGQEYEGLSETAKFDLQMRKALDARPNWDRLSGGERQRLVVARALVNKVKLVLADEATSGLDIANEELVYEQLDRAGIARVSVGHRPSLTKFHDFVIELLGDGNGGWRILPASQATWE